MLTTRSASFWMVVFSLSFASTGVASVQWTSSLTGTVVDETGGVLPGVAVTVQADAVQLEAVTDDTGAWRVEGALEGV